MVCLCGRKRLWLYPPGDARFVYPISKDLLYPRKGVYGI